MKSGVLFSIFVVLLASPAQAASRVLYAEGQVWEYHTRPSDEGSLLRIQKIEQSAQPANFGPIYHISIIGIHFASAPLSGQLQHAPVFASSLNASVTRLSKLQPVFPDPSEGIIQWRAANGGVFTIPIAEIVNLIEQTVPASAPAIISSQ